MDVCSEAEERLKALQEEAFKLSAELRNAGEPPSLLGPMAVITCPSACKHGIGVDAMQSMPILYAPPLL